MGKGRTNAGHGGGSSWSWYAYIQVSTDANASITATNPAGNTYTKQANSSGSVIFTVAYPGTYTISETGATSKTVVVADYGVAYPVSIYVPAPTGDYIIKNGVSYNGGGYDVYLSPTAARPLNSNVSYETPFVQSGVSRTNPVTGATENFLLFQLGNSNVGGSLHDIYKIDVTGKTKLYINMFYGQAFANLYFGLFNSISGGWINVAAQKMASYQTTGINTQLDISSYSGEYYIGVYGINDSNHSNTNAYIRDLYLA